MGAAGVAVLLQYGGGDFAIVGVLAVERNAKLETGSNISAEKSIIILRTFCGK